MIGRLLCRLGSHRAYHTNPVKSDDDGLWWSVRACARGCGFRDRYWSEYGAIWSREGDGCSLYWVDRGAVWILEDWVREAKRVAALKSRRAGEESNG